MIITAGIYKGRKILAPEESITRPTLSKVRMGVFNTLFSLIDEFEGKTFLDVFGGSGVMGLEALSRGFKNVKVFEKNPKAAQKIKRNYKTLGLTPDLYIGDSLKLLKNIDETFDVVYIDPPYQSGIYTNVIELVHGRIIVAEHSSETELNGFDVIKQKNYGGKIISFIAG